MKKKLALLLAVLMVLSISFTSCGNSNASLEEGTYLYEAINDKNVNNMLTNYPTAIEIFDNELGCGYLIDDSTTISELVGLFSIITVGSESTFDEFPAKTIDFQFGSKNYLVEFDENGIFLEGVEKFYELENAEALSDLISSLICEQFEINKEYTELLKYDGVTVLLGGIEEDEAGDVRFDLQLTNEDDKMYGVRINASVNDYKVNSFQTVFVTANNEVGYTVPIATHLLHEFGIENIGKINYTISLFEGDEENFTVGDLLYTTPEFEYVTDLYDIGDAIITGDAIYNQDGFEILYIESTDDYGYSSADFCFINHTGKEAKFIVNELKYNNEPFDLEGLPEVTEVEVFDAAFSYIPFYNYDYNGESVTIIPIESASVVFSIETEDGIINISPITLK